ncbi:unnamed protein product [Caenorhabditis bovis]|uniref:Uncharacterized protein n=1 Tax=Caenorhabditis bovis TaxID=2654633 RepID=A0A8S1EVJ4_9PELO|nr:unnamed protein product [Caenorhabditis bovis]
MIKRRHSRRCSPSPKRKRIESSPNRRKSSSDVVRPPPEFPTFDYEARCPTFTKFVELDPEDVTFSNSTLITLQHELEDMLAQCAMNMRRTKGELQFLNHGDYPKEDLKKRQFLICGLPEEDEEDDFNQFPPYHIPTRFWTWCKKDFLKNVDGEYLRSFKEMIVDKYTSKGIEQYLVNEPWKYRKRAASKGSRSANKTPKRVSISNEVSCSNGTTPKSNGRRISITRSQSSKDSVNNNKITPVIDSMVMSACKEYKDTPCRRASTKAEIEVKIENEEEDDEPEISFNQKLSPNGISPKSIKKERDGEIILNGNSNGFHSPGSDSRENGFIPNGVTPFRNCLTNGKLNGEKTGPKRKNGEKSPDLSMNDCEDMPPPLALEDFDAKAIGSKIVAKLIEGGILPESSALVFEQMSTSANERNCFELSKLSLNEDGREEADDPSVDELSAELKRCQLELLELQPQLNAAVSMAWRRAKSQYAFWHTYEQYKAADYDLFRLGVNMYRELPRKLPALLEQPILKEAMKRRNREARFHYGCTYRRHPKYRWKSRFLPSTSRKRASNSP